MDYERFQQLLTGMKTELHDLKTIQGGIKYCTAYTMNYVHSGSGQQQVNRQLEVEYGDGDGPIFSECLGSGSFMAPLEITDNKQRFFFRLLFDGQRLTFSSNRPILSVRLIP